MWSHVTIATEGRVTVLEGPDRLRLGVRTLARVGGARVLLFCIVDDHAHVVLTGVERDVPQIAGDLSRALRAIEVGPLQRAHVRAVEGRRHLETLVAYLVRQPEKHGISCHPALWEGSCALDLLGARRVLGFSIAGLEAALPRLAVRELVAETLRLSPDALRPASAAEVREGGAAALWAAVCAAACRGTADTKSPTDVAVRATYAALSTRAGLHAADARGAAEISRPAWYRLLRVRSDNALEWAAARRWVLERSVGGRRVSIRPAA